MSLDVSNILGGTFLGKENTFKKYVGEQYYNELFNKLSNFVEKHSSLIKELLNDDIRVTHCELYDFNVEAVYIQDKDNNRIDFDVVCKCTVEYDFTRYIHRHGDHDRDTKDNIWLVIHASTEITNLKGAKFYSVEQYEKEKKTKPLNGDMVPIIKASEYEKYAQDIIKKYYGNNYDFSRPINIRDLAKRMGLTINSLKPNFCFDKDKAIFAQIYFEDTVAKFYNKESEKFIEVKVKANTILLDNVVQAVYSYGSEDVTIAHECVHFALHKKAFEFSKYINNSEIKCISCYNDGKIKGVIETSNNESFMEAQANGIAPYLVMPTLALKEGADSLFVDYSRDSEPIDFMDRFVRDIRDKFHVTILLAKKRLKDIGFLNNIRVLEWDNEQNKYIEPYQYKKDSLKPDETFSITFGNYSKMVSDFNNALFKACFADDFLFVQNHVVYNDDKYIFRDDDGKLYLTEYARTHLDECALKFKIRSNNKYFSKNNVGTFCYLCKGIGDDMAFDLKLADENFISREQELPELIKKHKEAETKITRIIEDASTLGSCLKELKELYDFVPKELSDNGISETNFSRYINDKVEKIDIRKAICICHALKFTPKVSSTFINKFSNKGIMDDDEGRAFLNILNAMRGNTMKSINDFLIKLHLQPLF